MTDPIKAVWIIDDDPIYSQKLSRALNRNGIATKCFSVILEAIEQMKQGEEPSVVILDLMVPYDESACKSPPPDYNLELAAGIRGAEELIALGFPKTKFILITALDDTRHRDKLAALGIAAAQFLVKPVGGGVIYSKILGALRSPN